MQYSTIDIRNCKCQITIRFTRKIYQGIFCKWIWIDRACFDTRLADTYAILIGLIVVKFSPVVFPCSCCIILSRGSYVLLIGIVAIVVSSYFLPSPCCPVIASFLRLIIVGIILIGISICVYPSPCCPFSFSWLVRLLFASY
jgi:hypothetical protein